MNEPTPDKGSRHEPGPVAVDRQHIADRLLDVAAANRQLLADRLVDLAAANAGLDELSFDLVDDPDRHAHCWASGCNFHTSSAILGGMHQFVHYHDDEDHYMRIMKGWEAGDDRCAGYSTHGRTPVP